MSCSKKSPGNSGKNAGKRNLPSWMSCQGNENESCGKKQAGASQGEESNGGGNTKQAKGHSKQCTGSGSTSAKENSKTSASSSAATNFSKLLEGVVFVLSGFVNPERSILRSQALEMGAEFQPDWNSGCTLLICAFPNTPKFRQVEADCGTIVSKEWISECYSQRKLIDIESYLMHAGKPWRRSDSSCKTNLDPKASPPRKSQKQDRSYSKPITSGVAELNKAPNAAKQYFSPSEVKKWAIDDFNNTISWLESQEEKPEPSEIKKIAAEGILTCLQDAIESLEQKQDVCKLTEEWKFVPRVVEELAKLDGVRDNNTGSMSKKNLRRHAMECKRIYEVELSSLEDTSLRKNKRQPKGDEQKKDGKRIKSAGGGTAGYDSDETVEMTEEEIDLAYNTISSKIHKY
ncbi:DNA-repair protein XRCC1 [Ziziphus jujuba]|uniref:DNA-repair protein XRCC1 n=1 Tax=Ziziphus jujuba TaxID=326968 RepID=A0A6P3YXL7_ZIZJJ|nr:DNA-repair protein XRCC1 [Ziziphus jujuba]XP_048326474.2 DNA-repair protein XRCC1 [Ziziphus jujuba]